MKFAASFTIFLTLFSLPFFASGDTVGYFYALDADLSGLAESGVTESRQRLGDDVSVTVVRLGEHRVFALKMGAGSLTTALGAAMLFSREKCDMALSVGPAGSLSDKLAIGRWVRVSAVIDYQRGSETPAGFSRAENSTRTLSLPSTEGFPAALADAPSIRLASGSVFVASTAYRLALRSQTDADCVDMNLAGLAAACAVANVPLEAWKIVSDFANDSAPEDFRRFVKSYQGEGGHFAAEWIAARPKNLADPASHPNLDALLQSAPR